MIKWNESAGSTQREIDDWRSVANELAYRLKHRAVFAPEDRDDDGKALTQYERIKARYGNQTNETGTT